MPRQLGSTLAVLIGTWFAGLSGGCAAPHRSIFDEQSPSLCWPSCESVPRIRYVGQLTSSADLNPRRTPLQTFGGWLFGEDPPVEILGPQAVLPFPDEGLVWIADPGLRGLHLFDLLRRRHVLITEAGGAPLLAPVGLCAGPQESVYVCDAERGSVFQFDRQSGRPLGEMPLPELISRPVAMYFDEVAEELFVVDAIGHDIKVLSVRGDLLRVIGTRGTAPGEFNFPIAITVSRGLIWVADTGNHRVQALTRSGEPRLSIGQHGDAPGDFALIKSLALDSDGHLYVVDARFENVQVFDRSGHLLLYFGQEGHGRGQFWLPAGIAIDARNRIWICDSYNRRVQVFDYIGASVETSDDSD